MTETRTVDFTEMNETGKCCALLEAVLRGLGAWSPTSIARDTSSPGPMGATSRPPIRLIAPLGPTHGQRSILGGPMAGSNRWAVDDRPDWETEMAKPSGEERRFAVMMEKVEGEFKVVAEGLADLSRRVN